MYDYNTIKFQYDIFSGNLKKFIGVKNENLNYRFKIYDSIFSKK